MSHNLNRIAICCTKNICNRIRLLTENFPDMAETDLCFSSNLSIFFTGEYVATCYGIILCTHTLQHVTVLYCVHKTKLLLNNSDLFSVNVANLSVLSNFFSLLFANYKMRSPEYKSVCDEFYKIN